MAFVFDPQKSRQNLAKHGIDFVTAQQSWSDRNLLDVQAKTGEEPRRLVVGMIGKKHWSAIVTYRDDDIRIISVRRSHQREVAWYESREI